MRLGGFFLTVPPRRMRLERTQQVAAGLCNCIYRCLEGRLIGP
jgi:hypothetical protein